MGENGEAIKWFSLLASNIAWAALGTATPNLVAARARSHNTAKLINESLARLQLSFASYYMAALLIIESRTSILPRILGTAIVVSLLLYLIGLALTRDPDKAIRSGGHTCSLPHMCTERLPVKSLLYLLVGNAVLFTVSLSAAIYMVASPRWGLASQKPYIHSNDQSTPQREP